MVEDGTSSIFTEFTADYLHVNYLRSVHANSFRRHQVTHENINSAIR